MNLDIVSLNTVKLTIANSSCINWKYVIVEREENVSEMDRERNGSVGARRIIKY